LYNVSLTAKLLIYSTIVAQTLHFAMNKKAIIYDLDNTIYPVHTIAESLFEPFIKLINQYSEHTATIDAIKGDMMRKPFQVVAAQHNFSEDLIQRGNRLLQDMTYTGPISYFDDYPVIKTIPAQRFMVTTGFYNLQYSKIRGMGIENDFAEIHVVDPTTSAKTKKDVFADIMNRHNYTADELLVIGDDPASEIKAAIELGIDTVLYDKDNRYQQHPALYKISDFNELVRLV
jgi:putative hydrolase of the HAD superfamily